MKHYSIGKSTHRSGTAAAHARYITRPSAATVIVAERMPSQRKALREWFNEQEQTDRKNGRIIDKIMLPLPSLLHPLQRQKAVRLFCERISLNRAPWLFVIHDKGKDKHNPHAHVILRDKDPFTGKRVAGLSEKNSTRWLRHLWEHCLNEALIKAGRPERVSCLSEKPSNDTAMSDAKIGFATANP